MISGLGINEKRHLNKLPQKKVGSKKNFFGEKMENDDEEDFDEDRVPVDRFYVADEKNAAICVISSAWFAEHGGYAHSLFSMERRIRSHFPLPETQLVIGAMMTSLALEKVQYLVLTDAFLVECDGIAHRDTDPRNVSISSVRERAVSGLVYHGLLKGFFTRVLLLLFFHAHVTERAALHHPAYPKSTAYFVPPFRRILDIIARLDANVLATDCIKRKRIKVVE